MNPMHKTLTLDLFLMHRLKAFDLDFFRLTKWPKPVHAIGL